MSLDIRGHKMTNAITATAFGANRGRVGREVSEDICLALRARFSSISRPQNEPCEKGGGNHAIQEFIPRYACGS